MKTYSSPLPLCIDLDGTLIRTDVLSESLLLYFKAYPWKIFYILFWFLKGRPFLKKKIADAIDLNYALLPINQKVIDLILKYKSQGHPLYLITAAASKYGHALGQRFDFFDGIMTSDESTNLRSIQKANALIKRFGNEGYIYAGNSSHDLPVWEHAAEIIAINTPSFVLRKAARFNKTLTILEEGIWKKKEYIKYIPSLFYHPSNFLVLVPLLAIFSSYHFFFFLKIIIIYISLCFLEAGLKIICTLLSLNFYRINPRALINPLASGAWPIGSAFRFALLNICLALYLAFLVSSVILIIEILYMAFCLSDSDKRDKSTIRKVTKNILSFLIKIVISVIIMKHLNL